MVQIDKQILNANINVTLAKFHLSKCHNIQMLIKAQKIVEYSSSTQPRFNWRFIDEVTNVTMHLRKFTNADLPLLKRAK